MLSYGWAVATHFPAKAKDTATWRAARQGEARSTFLHWVTCPQDDLDCGRSDELSYHSSEGVNGAALGPCC